MARKTNILESIKRAKAARLRLGKGKSKRKVERITLEELNKSGGKLLRERADELKEKGDNRPTWQRALDAIDLPRNAVANAIVGITGTKTKDVGKGTFGLEKVFMSDVLDAVGVKSDFFKGGAGFGLDVAIDPLTYITLGMSSAARKIAGSAPRVLPKGITAVKQAAKQMIRGKAVNKTISSALGKSQSVLRRYGKKLVNAAMKSEGISRKAAEKIAIRELAGKNGLGKLTSLLATAADPSSVRTAKGLVKLKSSSAFLAKHGEKGRTVFKVPGIGSIRLPGKRKELYKQVKEAAKGTGPIIEAAETGRALSRQAAVDTVRSLGKVSKAKTLLKQRKGVTKAAQKGLSKIRKTVKAMQSASAESNTTIQSLKKLKTQLSGSKGGQKALRRKIALLEKKAGIQVKAFKTKIDKLKGRTEHLKDFAVELKAKVVANLNEARKLKKGATTLEASRKAGFALGAPDLNIASKLKGEFEIGKTRNTFLSRLKEQVFGPGESPLHRREAGIKAAGTSHAFAAGEFADAEVAKIIDPLVGRLSKSAKITPDDAMSRLGDFLDVKATRAGDVRGTRLAETAEMIRKADMGTETADALRGVRKVYDDAFDAMKARGVQPEFKRGFQPRIFTKEGTQSAAEQVRRMGKDPGTLRRIQDIDYRHPVTGEVKQVFSTADKEIKALVEGGFELEKRFDISVAQMNKWAEQGMGPFRSKFDPTYKGKFFQTNIPKNVGKAIQQKHVRIAMADLRDLVNEHSVDLGTDLIKNNPLFAHMAPALPADLANTPFGQTVGKQLAGKSVPLPVANMVRRMAEISADPKAINGILRASDKMLQLWKGVTLMHPAYTTRNVVQNTIGATMSGLNPLKFAGRVGDKNLKRLIRAMDYGEELKGTINIAGRQVPLKVLADQLKSYNLINSGLVADVLKTGMMGKAKHFLGKGSLTRKWMRFNNRIENRMRAAAFVEFLEQGYDVRQSALKAVQAMPDLSDMTKFENTVAKRIIPFYSWFRKNGALQLFHYLPNKPAYFANAPRLGRMMETAISGDAVVPDDLRPAWMREQFGVQIGGDEDMGKVFLLSSWLPFEELTKLMEGVISPNEGARSILERMRPGLKGLVEFGTDQDIFRRRPFEPFTIKDLIVKSPKALIGRSGTPLDNMLSVRPVRAAFRVGDMPSTGAKVTRAALGGAFQPVDRAAGLKETKRQLVTKIGKLRSKINRAKQVNDPVEVENLLSQYWKAVIQLHRLGEGGVPKATKKLLEDAGIVEGSRYAG